MNPHHLERRRVMQMLTATMIGSAVLTSPTCASLLPGSAPGESRAKSRDQSHDKSGAVFIPAGSGKKGGFGNNSAAEITFKLDKSQTNGHLGCAEVNLQPGRMGAVPHFHQSFDEICRVLEGTVTVLVGDEVVDVPAGAWHLRPRGKVHSYWNTGNVASRAIEMYIPGGHEEYMKALTELFANPVPPTPDEVGLLGKRYDTTFAWDRLPILMKKYGVTP